MPLILYDVNEFGDDVCCHPCEHSRMEGLATRIRELAKDHKSLRIMSRRCGLAPTQIGSTLKTLEAPNPKKGSDVSARILAKIATGCHVSLHWLVLGEGPRRIGDAPEVSDAPTELNTLNLGQEQRELVRVVLAQGASIVDVRHAIEDVAEDLKLLSAGQFYDLIKRRRDERTDVRRTIRAGGRLDVPLLVTATREQNMQLGDHPNRGTTMDDAVSAVLHGEKTPTIGASDKSPTSSKK